MNKMGVFTVMLPDLTPEEAAPALKAAGYDGVEWRVTHVPEERRQEHPSFWGNNLCTLCPSASLAHRLVSYFDPETIGVIYDPGNMVHEGFEDYRIGLELLGPYLAHVHLKNAAFSWPEGDGGVWTPRWAPLEDGVVNLPQLFNALHAVDYAGW